MEIVHEISRSDMCSRVRTYQKDHHPFHWHEKYEIFQILNNHCRFLVDGQIIDARQGDILAINSQAVHRLMVDCDDTRVRVIQFPLGILLHAGVAIKPLKPHITHQELAAHPQLQEALERILPIMDREHSLRQAQSSAILQSLCASVYFLLMRHFAAEEPLGAADDERMEFYKAADFANRHYTSNINIQIMAGRLYIPRARLAKLFRKYSGTGLNEYINTLRIRHANQLLMGGSPVTQAAIESGFQSIRTFNQACKDQTGMTPTEYIKSLQKQG